MSTPVVFQYQQALDEFRREGREPPLLKRMSELISLLDLTATLNSTLSGREILDAALLIVMGELQVSRGALYVRDPDGSLRLRSVRGLRPEPPGALELDDAPVAPVEAVASHPAFADLGLALVCPVRKAERTIALLALGPRPEGLAFGREEKGFLQSLAACAATPIENGLMYDELHRVNRSLSVKVFQLHNLFDIGRELTSSLDEEAIKRLVITTVMGHFLASRGALYLLGDGGLVLAHVRGLPPGESPVALPPGTAAEALGGPRRVEDLEAGPLREGLTRGRFALVVPLDAGGRVSGLLAVGERASGAAFRDEDLEYAQALARQAQAALEGARLHRVALEKERQDRELQIAQEIQRSLFPRSTPTLEGLELAAESHPCHQVGGDYYDFIPLDGGCMGLVIADVSGKGTPASILMASVHASLRATAGTASPAVLLERLNRFLCASTQESKYVTLFYGEVDPASRSLRFVNAGHIPPYLVRRGCEVERLRAGGPVLGLLEEAGFEEGEVILGEGDLLAVVTDGVTEALSPGEEEFGDARACSSLCDARGGAAAVLRGLLDAVEEWTARASFDDDLTALIVRAR
jgi:sigma-B regulation protein RsbU (phosphoserine phosphatase)